MTFARCRELYACLDELARWVSMAWRCRWPERAGCRGKSER